VFHATPAVTWPSIRRYGIRPRNGWIYVAEDEQSARDFADDVWKGYGRHPLRSKQWALLRVSLDDIVLDSFERDPDSGERSYRVRLGGTIPPSHVHFVEYFSVGDS